MALTGEQRKQIAAIFREFAEQTSDRLRTTQVSDLNFNPFLLRLLSNRLRLNDSESITKWAVAQRLERGNVTAFGIALKKVAQVFSEEVVADVDVVTRRQEKVYHWRVTSGPTAMSKPASEKLVQDMQAVKARNPGSIPALGLCYGNNDAVSPIMKKQIEEKGGIKIAAGRVFWEFLSGDPNCVDEIYDVCRAVGQDQILPIKESSSHSQEYQMERLVLDFERIYGDPDFWARLLKLNV